MPNAARDFVRSPVTVGVKCTDVAIAIREKSATVRERKRPLARVPSARAPVAVRSCR